PDGSAVLQIPIDDGDVPNLVVQVDMVGTTKRTADDGAPLPDSPPRPAFATAQITLSVPPVTRGLTVTATPAADAVVPGTDTSVTVQVLGPDGAPVSDAAVAVVVVDEAVLALTGYQLADPLDVFYAHLSSAVTSQYTRSSILLTRSDLVGGLQSGGDDSARAEATAAPAATDASSTSDYLAEESDAGGAEAPAAQEPAPQIDVRENFDALAVYAPDQTTGVDGTVTVDVPLPDSLTRYRVMAVAVDGAERFGKGESTITARLPVMVRPSAPRFLNFGDQFELPVVVQNQTDTALDVEVVVQGANLALADAADTGAAGKRVTVPANDRVEVRFAAGADQVGTARIRVAAAGAAGVGSDAAVVELPVYTPATTEAFATYGVIDDATPGAVISQPISAPTDVFAQFGGLEIGTSSTALQALTDAVIYLQDYPYQTADGYSSRIMAIASLRDVLDTFDAAGLPDPAALNARVDADIAALDALQNDDGGWSWWARGLESSPWQSIQSTHALVLAEHAGYDVPDATLSAALAFLADIESHIPSDCSREVRTALRAYAIHVRTLAGDRDVTKATSIYDESGDDLQLDAMAWLWPSIDDGEIRAEIERRFENAATETANAVTFATSYGEDAYLIADSDRRTDGVILDALIGETPGSDLIVKAVNGLLGHQTRGRWNSAQDNAFVLIAMNRYFHTFESVTPDMVARAWIGDVYAAEHEYRGRTTDRDNTLVPMEQLTQDTDIVVQREGAGRLYYRLGLRYAAEDLELAARDEGFVIDRVYEAVDDPADVSRDADGTWHVRAGATVRVRLTMVADARRTHVALVDPLPAGLEPVNPALQVSQTFPPEESYTDAMTTDAMSWCWCWHWFEHQNMRDDRVEAFTSYLAGGTYEYSYIARATTPGQFVVPPAKAEELYAPEVFGRSASATVVVA
ncbi:MAG TPA: alpha-2-macroglobulin family protein, partial [Ilumatobacter sp.]|nr:alpha-2-macroglobulin family protein [Ilumatobacter sp.]